MSFSCWSGTVIQVMPGYHRCGKTLLRDRFFRNNWSVSLAFQSELCHISSMDLPVKYQGKVATTQEVEFIKKLIAANPHDSRWRLSRKLCEAWNWVQPNGHLRDMVCRGFMLRLQEAGYIKLPPRKRRPNNPLAHRTKPPKIAIEQIPLGGSLKEIQPIDIRQVRRTPADRLCEKYL